MARLSVIIPSRDERFLTPTIDDIFSHAEGEIEVVAVLDSEKWPGDWKEVSDRHPNLHTIHNGTSRGMRYSINAGVASAVSRGAKYVMKLDGHCSLSQGFDEVLKADCDKDWVVVPRRGRLHPENWVASDTHKPDIDYHYLSFPNDPDDFGGPGLNGKVWEQRAVVRKNILVDDEMSSQGSCWFMHADYFNYLDLMDEAKWGTFWCEFQEVGFHAWLSGGQVKVNKNAKYLHLHKGKKYGRGYKLNEKELQKGRTAAMLWPWNEDGWSKQILPFSWLIEHFWPVPSWPENWEEVLYATRRPKTITKHKTEAVVSTDAVDTADSLRTVSTGLVIHAAYYGLSDRAGDFVEVSERLQSLVKDDSLDIIVNNSTLTPGQNPFRGQKKRLHLVYSLDGVERVERIVEEKDWLIIGPVATREAVREAEQFIEGTRAKVAELKQQKEFQGSSAQWLRENVAGPINSIEQVRTTKTYRETVMADWPTLYIPDGVNSPVPTTAPALNDYLIRKFQISPQRLRGPMPIELRDFHRNNLAQLFAELGFKRGAEIGVAEGHYSEILLKANPELRLLMIDPWHHYSDNPQGKSKEKHEFAYNEAKRRIQGYKNALLVEEYSMVAASRIKETLDFVYIDGNHLFDYVMQDLIEWSKKVRSGGIVSGDDYYALDQKRWIGGGVVEAVQAYTNAHRIPLWFIFEGHKSTDFMWVKP